MAMAERLPHLADYATSRAVLLAEVEAHGATTEHHVHPSTGPAGEELATDVARFGAPTGAADTVVVVASGTHGVEGHAGWGLQRLLVASGRLDALPPGVAVVVVHAVNPYGMAWSRRVDHDNVDVNRNFVDFDHELPANPDYDRLADLLNPAGDTLDPADTSWQDELWSRASDIGMAETYRAVSGGQYHVPDGVQFGGRHPTWSRQTLRRIWVRHLTGARAVIHLDLHTGLGPCGGLSVFQYADSDEPAAELVADRFTNVARSDRPATTDPALVGVVGPGLEAELDPATSAVPVVIEFGTLDAATVLAGMRADNWLHHHGDPTSELGRRIRAGMREAFFVDDERWREQVATAGTASIHAGIDLAVELATA